MRFGYCLNMTATRPDKTGIEHLEALAALGYDYAELPCAEMAAMEESDFARLNERVKNSGIACEVSNNFFPPSMRLTGPSVDCAAIDSYVGRALDRLALLGVRVLVFGSGGAKNVPEGFSMAQGYAQVVRLLKRVSPAAAQRSITIVIEPLRRAECNLINTFEEGVALARDVGRDNVRVLVDYYHVREMDEPVAHLAEYGRAYLGHVHFARQAGRRCPRDLAEDAHYIPFMQALRAAGYDGRVSCEAYAADFVPDARGALAFLRALTGAWGCGAPSVS